MHLIFGGAYQGKLDYAKEKFYLSDTDIYICSEDNAELDFSKKIIYGIEKFALACVKKGEEARDIFAEAKPPSDIIVICTDISQGVVPTDPQLRAWREMTGRLMAYLAAESKSVTRIFCGLPQILK